MDYRNSLLKKLYRLDGDPTIEQIALIGEHKQLIFNGLLQAIEGGVNVSRVAVLVDERYGASVAVRARAAGIQLGMPIERSGETLFLLDYGNFGDGQWLRHVEEFGPAVVKVLVRDNPLASTNRMLQFDRLISVSEMVRRSGRTFLLELEVAPTPAQLKSVEFDLLRYDCELRAELTVTLIETLQDEGIEPHLWAIAGPESDSDARALVAAARRDGRTAVSLLVGDRNATRSRLQHRLEVARAVDGFGGFAIGTTVWEEPLAALLAGTAMADDLVAAVAANFTELLRHWHP